MTNKEAIKILEELPDRIVSVLMPLDIDFDYKEALDLAIKALEIIDDVNHKIYRNENCPQKYKCYDYQGYHCTGCSWEKKGGVE